ncbi:MAG: acyl-CoA dehydrogenase family protein [Eubacterium sp.]|nr:acyl-CoA dehydrogenase family protein [Eubacterium sp.]
MNTYFSEEQLALKERVAKFAAEVLAPEVGRIDKEGFDMEHYRKVMASGLVAVAVPKADGGEGMGTVGRCIVLEEMSKVDPSTALSFLVGGMGMYATSASDELKEKYYYPWVRGEILPAFALTEPGAGSDVSSVKTTAVKDGDEYVLNGVKTLIVNGKSADVLNVYAITDTTVKTSKGMSVFAVPTDLPGISVRVQDMMTLRGSEVAEITFTDCRVPAANLVGELGKGFAYAMGGIAGGRINAAACSIGIADSAVADAVRYANTRVQFGKPISANQAIAHQIAKMECKLESARALLYKAADMIDHGDKDAGVFASIAKREATDAAQYCADNNLMIHGGIGCTTECIAERIYRDAHAARIYDGTSDILDLIVARYMLG